MKKLTKMFNLMEKQSQNRLELLADQLLDQHDGQIQFDTQGKLTARFAVKQDEAAFTVKMNADGSSEVKDFTPEKIKKKNPKLHKKLQNEAYRVREQLKRLNNEWKLELNSINEADVLSFPTRQDNPASTHKSLSASQRQLNLMLTSFGGKGHVNDDEMLYYRSWTLDFPDPVNAMVTVGHDGERHYLDFDMSDLQSLGTEGDVDEVIKLLQTVKLVIAEAEILIDRYQEEINK